MTVEGQPKGMFNVDDASNVAMAIWGLAPSLLALFRAHNFHHTVTQASLCFGAKGGSYTLDADKVADGIMHCRLAHTKHPFTREHCEALLEQMRRVTILYPLMSGEVDGRKVPVHDEFRFRFTVASLFMS
ncbi:MAG TPA: hypothetical protein VFM05_12975 [Candidatus Saccharimonadales bacterium]|nr:hypothetical protein [Candidatus Saccharimonadales bacterium]